jgi:hypothetical protein
MVSVKAVNQRGLEGWDWGAHDDPVTHGRGSHPARYSAT